VLSNRNHTQGLPRGDIPRIKMNDKQEFAYCDILNFLLNKNKSAYVLSGVAGSGKTTLASALIYFLESYLQFSVAVISYTGRATSVLNNNLAEYSMYPMPMTCHRMLYNTTVENGKFVFNKIPPQQHREVFDIILVDESQMISEELFNDIMDIGLPVIFIGDKEQLPPIVQTDSENKEFNIMEAFDYHLSDIIRQENGSPIISLSHNIIKTGHINMSGTNDAVKFMKKSDVTIHNIQGLADVILTGTNKMRTQFNNLMRAAKHITTQHAVETETIMCVRNSCDLNGNYVANGERFRVQSFSEIKNATIGGYGKKNKVIPYREYLIEKADYKNVVWIVVNVPEECWENEHMRHEDFILNCPVPFCFFTFGYAMSVWKACGSEFDSVLFFDEDVGYFVDRTRFRYTAVTRAKQNLIVVR